MRLRVLLLALALSGCASTDVVQLRNGAGMTVQCGPYESFGAISGIQADQRVRDCVTDFQRQGYERVGG